MVNALSRRYNAVMSKLKHISETPATQFLRRNKVEFGEHPYEYVEHGGTEESRGSSVSMNTAWSRRS